MNSIDAFNVLYNYDMNVSIYIVHPSNQLPTIKQETSSFSLRDIIMNDLKEEHLAIKGAIIMATAPGDIYDIDKNIIKVVLESYGYKVVLLGKEVPPLLKRSLKPIINTNQKQLILIP